MDPMRLTREEVDHIASLARLELTEEEKNLFRDQLSAILGHAARLQAIDTASIEPTSTVLARRAPLRPDAARPGLSVKEALSNAPSAEADQFRVPPVQEQP